ncbi:unnamed protein product [Thlaspi arvense]|uniref:Uncharacterized protein n=1 Tax=Thlaspi arvense TaxID=13288 RepID=A0AAU9SV26_THLAR|nr:unnamed protein product [Thlaspi arvense]
MTRLVSSVHNRKKEEEEMEGEGRREDGVSSYLCMPFNFIHETLQSLFVKFLGLRSHPNNFSISQDEEETEVVEVSSRNLSAKQNKQNTSSGKPGRINKKPS